MTIFSTPESAKAFSVDVEGIAPRDVIPSALVIATSTQAGAVDGDEPQVRVPFVQVDDGAAFVPEGEAIEEAEPESREVVIGTGRVSVLVGITREQYGQGQAADLMSDAVRSALIRKANRAYLAQEAPAPGETTPPAGLLNQNPYDGGVIGDNLDALIDAVAHIESAGGAASHIIAHPAAWATLAKLKTGIDSNVSLVGAGTGDAERRLLNLPVLVDRDAPTGGLLVLDKRAVLSVYSPVEVATSEHFYFDKNTVAVRALFRFGAKIADTNRVVQLGVDGS